MFFLFMFFVFVFFAGMLVSLGGFLFCFFFVLNFYFFFFIFLHFQRRFYCSGNQLPYKFLRRVCHFFRFRVYGS